MKKRPAIAFAGTGWIGFNRMKYLLRENNCDVVAIYDPDPSSSAKALSLAPAAFLADSFEELLGMNPDGIVIATPSAMHAGLSVMALERGIAVFCQKPLGRNSAETMSVISAASAADRLLGVDMSYRFTDGMNKIEQVKGELGNIFAADLVFNNAWGPDKAWFYDPALSGGGCLLDLGIHLIDLAFRVIGTRKVKNVCSSILSNGKIPSSGIDNTVEDYVSAQMETEDGVIIRLVCSWNLPAGKDAEIGASFYGTNASAQFYNINGSFYDFEAALCFGTSRKVISSPPDDWGGRAIVRWSEELMNGGKYNPTALEYYNTAEVIDMIYKKTILIPRSNEAAYHN